MMFFLDDYFNNLLAYILFISKNYKLKKFAGGTAKYVNQGDRKCLYHSFVKYLLTSFCGSFRNLQLIFPYTFKHLMFCFF